ncbi:MAG: hypothetical protein ACPG21_07345 [Crocinitomicaceae bacterium]
MSRFIKHITFCFGILFCLNNSFAAAIYYSSVDYGCADSLGVENIIHKKNELHVVHEDGSIHAVDLNNNVIWGFRNKWGEDYRFDKSNKSWRIIEYGKISVFVDPKKIAASTDNPDIAPGYQDSPYELNKYHRYALTPDGELIKYSRKRFLKGLESDPALRKRFLKILNEQPANLLLYIMKYNADLWLE